MTRKFRLKKMAKFYYLHFSQSEWDLDCWIDYYLDQGLTQDEAERQAALSIAATNGFEEAPELESSDSTNQEEYPF